jgi:16S rRNA (guanine527-N7)-methyltransferase
MFSPSRLPLAASYAVWLADAGTVRGLIGPREVPRLWERHLLNCAVLAEVIPPDARVCDLGSGAGLPGLVLAIARPDLRVTLVEPLLRRTTFLDEVATDLVLDGVEVVRGRAEALHGTRTFEVVTSRALAPWERLLGWSMPLVAPRGSLVAMKGSSITAEIAACRDVLATGGYAEPEVLELGTTVLESPTVVVRVAWADPEQVHFAKPRPSGDRSVGLAEGAVRRPPRRERRPRGR